MKKLIPILFAASIAAYAQSPYITTTFPAGGSGTTATITADAAFSSASQADYIWVRFDGNNHGCDVLIQVQYNNVFWLLSDDGSTWGSPSVSGSGATLQNSQCIIPASGVTGYLAGGNIAAANVAATFKPAFAGVRAISAQAYSLDGSISPWYNGGTWTVPGPSCPPGVTGISPFNGSGSSQAFTISTVDACAGAANIQYIWLRVGTPGWDHSHDCDALWMLQDNTIHLLSDDGTNWNIGGPFGGSGTISNSQCSIPLSTAGKSIVGSTVSGSATIIPVGSYSGTKEISGTVAGYNSLGWNWFTAGNWTIPMPHANGSMITLESSGPTLLVPYVRFSLPDGSDPYVWDVATKGQSFVMTVRDAAPNSQVWARQMFAGIGRELNGDRDDIFFKPTLGPWGNNYYSFDAIDNPDSVLNNIGWLVGVTDANGYFSGTFTAGPFGANGVSVYVGNSTGSAGPANADGSQSNSSFLVDSNYIGGFVFWVQNNGNPASPNIQ